jgi:hypothetical protein
MAAVVEENICTGLAYRSKGLGHQTTAGSGEAIVVRQIAPNLTRQQFWLAQGSG